MKTTIPQIFDEVNKAPTRQDRINVLRAYDHPVLRGVLQINFNPDVKVHLPPGHPPHKRDESIPMGYSETNLFAEFRRMYIWLDETINLHKMKKEQLFIQMLEGIHWSEGDDLCLAKDKILETKYKNLTEDIVREAFPDALPPAKPKEKKEAIAKKVKVSLND